MSIRFACPVCKTGYTVRDQDAGKKSDCKTCGQRLEVPKPRAKTVLGRLEPADPEPDPPAFGDLPPDDFDYAPGDVVPPERYTLRADVRPRGRPGKVQAIAFMVLLGGGWAILWALAGVLLSGCLCLAWPGTYYDIVFGILAVIRGAELMGSGAGARRSPRTILVMQIIAVANADVANLACGIVGFVFLNDPRVERYYGREEAGA
jgi:hypothetical protein